MRRILWAVAGYAFMAWWNNRAASQDDRARKQTRRGKTADARKRRAPDAKSAQTQGNPVRG